MASVSPVPMHPYPPGKPPQASTNGTTIVVIILAIMGGILLLVIGCVVAIVISMSAALAPAVSSARDAARSAESKNNLKRMGLRIHNYHDTFRQFPSAYTACETRWHVAAVARLRVSSGEPE